METGSILADIAARAAKASVLRPEDYQGQNGLWYCGRCNTKKQTVIEWPGIAEPVTVFCLCRCESERNGQYRERKREKERAESVRREGLSDMGSAKAKEMTLDADDGSCPYMTTLARRYVDAWDSFCTTGKAGLLLWGSPGTGKTFFATAIGNALAQRGVSVARITAARVVESAQGLYDYEHGRFISTINSHDLLILDDIGAERDTPFAREVLTQLVEARVNLKRALITTTNLTLDQMREPKTRSGEIDMGYKRIFDRIIGMSTPVQISGESHRRKQGAEAREMMKGVYRGNAI